MKTNVTYHPDHLGSSSFVTNKFGEATQELRYTPNGEILLNMYDNYNTPYKFSAKEKDAETGFNYHGARYYIDYMYVWMSPDPLSDEYPSTSPYMYCSGNPVMKIDPNGEDQIEVDKQTGQMKRGKESEKDVIFITRNGKRTGIQSKEFDKKSIYFLESKEKQANGLPEYSDVRVKDAGTGRDVYNFLADNTSVEWGKIESITKYDNKEEVGVYTSHMEGKEKRSPFIVASENFIENYDLIEHSHSHPYNKFRSQATAHYSSDKDRKFKDEMLKHFPNAKFKIRFGGGFERDYTKDNKKYYGQ